MTLEQQIAGARDQFPAGMRVLAVDDDPTCLLLLETLLRRCQYHVTTTSQAVAALKMLRENRNRFDLVISDVHMPDMDGFKLLELVGLEMDLPVIMLSANGDPKLVMKGITHGACDYLLKPIRIEELKNIWQHVIRRRKFENKDQNSFENSEKPPNEGSEAIADQKLSKKRKDQNEDEDEDRDENGHENDDPTTQKKPRVVWSVDLHRKFVAAVNQLGIDKAVPKKILDLMNVEKLTRENVASHLQKYRLYLKRISTVANQQAHMVAALGSTDPSYLQMGSVPRLGFPNLNGTGQFHCPNGSLRPLPSNGILTRLNSSASLGIRGLPSPGGVIQLGHMQNPAHFQPVMHNDRNVLQGMPTSLGLELPSVINDTTGFSVSGGKPVAGGSTGHYLGGSSNNPLADSLDPGYKDCWSTNGGVQSNPFPDCFKLRDSMSEMALQSVDSSNVSPISNGTLGWNDQRLDAIYQSNSMCSSVNSGIPGNGGCVLDPNNSVFGRTGSFDSARQPNFVEASLMRDNVSGNMGLEAIMRSNDRYMGQPKNPGSYISNNFGSLEDIAGVIVKQEPDKVVTDDFGCGLFA